MDKNNNNEKLKKILQESVNDEFKDVSEELLFEPSKNFKKDMNTLVKEQKHPYLKMCKTKKGKTFIVLVAILVFALSSLSVGAVRETVARVIKAIPSIIMPEKKEKPKKPAPTKATHPVIKNKDKPKKVYPLATDDEAVREEDGSSSTQPTDGTVFESSTTTYETIIMPSTVAVPNEVTEAPPTSQ